MHDNHVEYDRDVNPYPRSGKKYNGERAIISLTSWKARINTVPKTLFSLIKNCPGFHIVLVLSEEEFPQKEDELPDELMVFVDNDLIELLWVYGNYKSLKKILFTMDVYRDVPVISADDDEIYIINYADELYQTWLEHKDSLITMYPRHLAKRTAGPSTLYYPHCFGGFNVRELFSNPHLDIYEHADDGYYEMLRGKYKDSTIVCINKKPCREHDAHSPLELIYGHCTFMAKLREAQNDDIQGNIYDIIGPD